MTPKLEVNERSQVPNARNPNGSKTVYESAALQERDQPGGRAGWDDRTGGLGWVHFMPIRGPEAHAMPQTRYNL